MTRDSLGHEPGHADMDAVAERGDGRAAIPRRARYDRRCSVLLSNKKENRRSEKLRFQAAPKTHRVRVEFVREFLLAAHRALLAGSRRRPATKSCCLHSY